ncbi:MAG: FKBP-type peptidyl-prolyl cis-trans isomerase [Planctomycetes bacterium]|nr:FKBP-type peptidyl-prolyl cis-trans isomerase [Planctomycetota bacterium]
MRAHWIVAVLAAALLAATFVSGDEKAGPAGKPELKTSRDKASYAMGINIGRSFKAQGMDLDLKLVTKGLEDATSGAAALMTDAEARDAVQSYQKEASGKAGDRNKQDGEAFLAANKSKPGVTTLPSGLQYKVLTEGTGEKPKATDTVKTHYKGTLISGKEFDSSYSRGEPTQFPVGGVIKGWTEALQLMPVGSKWQLFVPSDLAYGARGAGADIGPNATLIFEVELLEIVK